MHIVWQHGGSPWKMTRWQGKWRVDKENDALTRKMTPWQEKWRVDKEKDALTRKMTIDKESNALTRKTTHWQGKWRVDKENDALTRKVMRWQGRWCDDKENDALTRKKTGPALLKTQQYTKFHTVLKGRFVFEYRGIISANPLDLYCRVHCGVL